MRGGRLLSPRLIVHLLAVRPFIRLILGLSLSGGEHLRRNGPFILAANHNSHLDAFLLLAALPPTVLARTRPVAAADHFSRNRLLFSLAEWLVDPVWIDRKGPARRSLEGMEEWLASGGGLVIFPEGTRGEPGRLERFREGLGRIAARFPEIPVIPAWLSGTGRSLPRRAVIPVPVWSSLIVGPPLLDRGGRREITAALHARIEELGRLAPGAGRPPRPRPVSVAVLGIDGSGKSTLSRSLARALSSAGRACHVGDRLEILEEGEPSRLQPLPSERLRRALAARARRAGSLGSYKLPKLAEILLRDHLVKEARRWYRPGFVVLDGSPLLNLAAWAGLYREECLSRQECAAALAILTTGGEAASSGDPLYGRFPELAALAGLGMARFDLPGAVILLDVEPAVAMERIRRRGAPLQAHETEESLRRLRDGYRTAAGVVREELRIPCLTIPGACGKEEALERAAAFAAAAAGGDGRPEPAGGAAPGPAGEGREAEIRRMDPEGPSARRGGAPPPEEPRPAPGSSRRREGGRRSS